MCKHIDIDKLMASGQVLKDDTATTVVRTSWMGREVVIKRYNDRGILRSLRNFFRPSRAKRACIYGYLLKRLGIPAPEPLAYKEKRRFGIVRESFLIMSCIDGVLFHHYIRNEQIPRDDRRRVVEKIKDIMASLAGQKISHGDLKHSNFIIAGQSPVLIDLDSMKFHWLAVMAKRGAKKDLTRFMLGLNTDDISAPMRQICAEVMDFHGPLPYHWTNNYFSIASRRQDDWTLLIRRGFNPKDAKAIIEGGVCLDDTLYTRVNSSKTAQVWAATTGFRGEGIRIFIKLHLQRSVIDFIKHFFRDSRGRRAFKASIMLRQNGLDCPEPLALLEKRLGPFCLENILVTAGIADCMKLQVCFRQLDAQGTLQAQREKRTIITNLGAYIGKMHMLGIYHGDLRTGNILLQNDSGQLRFYLIDNERTCKFAAIPGRLVIKNLVQINMFREKISNSDRMCFLKGYSKETGLSKNEIIRLSRRVVRLTQKRLKTRLLHHDSVI